MISNFRRPEGRAGCCEAKIRALMAPLLVKTGLHALCRVQKPPAFLGWRILGLSSQCPGETGVRTGGLLGSKGTVRIGQERLAQYPQWDPGGEAPLRKLAASGIMGFLPRANQSGTFFFHPPFYLFGFPGCLQ